ncbi:response regulator [bacterium]|nr:response regulator [bacterium]
MENQTNTQPLILIVDDDTINIDILLEALQDEYRLGIAKNGIKALEYVNNTKPDLILLDIMMPELNGFDVCERLKSSDDTKDIAIIFLTALQDTANKYKGFELGAVDYITKPFNIVEVKARVQTHLSVKRMSEELSNQNVILQSMVEEKTHQIQNIFKSTIQVMAQMVETRDPYIAGHQQRVAGLACIIAEKMSMSFSEIETIRIAGILHDIGKIRIPLNILNRPGSILDAEYELLKIHPQIGFELLSGIPFEKPIAQIVYQHHEKLDGSGYPQGLTDKEILKEAKILSVADVVEAMSSHRPYRAALGNERALEEIVKYKGIHFDPEAVETCRVLFEEEGFTI